MREYAEKNLTWDKKMKQLEIFLRSIESKNVTK